MEKWQIYVQEGRTQVRFAVRSFEQYEKARDEANSEDIFYHLHHFIVHATNVFKIFHPNAPPERTRILGGRVELTGIDEKPTRDIRNLLEHYERHLDKWIAAFYGGPFFDMNITTGSVGFPYHAALRALDGNTFRFVGESYDLPSILTNLLELDTRLEALEQAGG